MSNLQVLESKVTANTIDSREIAEMLEMEHWQLLRKLEGSESAKVVGIIPTLNDNGIVVVDYFKESTYVDSKGETRKCYLFTKMGCEFIANKFTGEKGILFSARYVERFNRMEQTIQAGILGNLSPELQAIFAHDARMQIQDKKINIVETRVDKLENTMVVDHGQGKELERLRKGRVIAIFGGKDSPAYKEFSSRMYRAIARDYQDYFNIISYDNTPVARFEEAKNYLKNWMPDNNLQLEINMFNRGGI